MTSLPDPALTDPLLGPAAFLRALLAGAADHDDLRARAEAAGCVVHALSDCPATEEAATAATAALQAAGARAIAATLARGGQPILLVSQGLAAGEAYAAALAEGLMGYERIFALVCAPSGAAGAVEVTGDSRSDGLRLILILPPTVANSYWQR